MKLYIWAQPYSTPYGYSMLYAVAETEDQARELAKSAKLQEYGQAESPTPLNSDQVDALGKPDRVLDLPCAEFIEWAE